MVRPIWLATIWFTNYWKLAILMFPKFDITLFGSPLYFWNGLANMLNLKIWLKQLNWRIWIKQIKTADLMFEFQGINKICIQSKIIQLNSNLNCKSLKYNIAYACSQKELKKESFYWLPFSHGDTMIIYYHVLKQTIWLQLSSPSPSHDRHYKKCPRRDSISGPPALQPEFLTL